MGSSSGEEREVRAAHNQAVFRAVNERLRLMNEAFETMTGRQTITCECADIGCVETLRVSSAEYDDIRANPRRFFVLRGHVTPR
jgi:hypothetical protein